MAKHFYKTTETRDELSTTCYPNKTYVKVPVSTLPQVQAAITNMLSVVSIQVFSIMHS